MTTTKFRRVLLGSVDNQASQITEAAKATGLYESDICRVERDQDGLWGAEVPMRQIGNSAYMEFRSVGLGGHWMRIGKYRAKAG